MVDYSLNYIGKCLCFFFTMVASIAETSSNLQNSKLQHAIQKRSIENNGPAVLLFDNDPNYKGHIDFNKVEDVGAIDMENNVEPSSLLKLLLSQFQQNQPNEPRQQKAALRLKIPIAVPTECTEQDACKGDCKVKKRGVEMQECIIQCTILFKCGVRGVLPLEDEDDCGGESNECGCKKHPNPSTRRPVEEDQNASWSQCC